MDTLNPLPHQQPRTETAPRTEVREGLLVDRGACACVGALAGTIPVMCCSIGLVPAILTGLGLGTAYFAIDKQIIWGFGWTPVLSLAAAILILAASYLLARPVFASHGSAIARPMFWRTAGYMALAAGITFMLWMQVIIPLMFIAGVPMGALFHR